MKIYVITSGEYSDYGIHGATVDKATAEAWIEKRYKQLKESGNRDEEKDCPLYSVEYEIEEYDSEHIGKWLNGYDVYWIKFDMAGNIKQLQKENQSNFCNDERPHYFPVNRWNKEECISVRVYAKSQDEAVKIAAEKRARFIHEQDLKAMMKGE